MSAVIVLVFQFLSLSFGSCFGLVFATKVAYIMIIPIRVITKCVKGIGTKGGTCSFVHMLLGGNEGAA